uniref:SNRNP25 ubiquitin-like domain-containing protein n=1 Tax=Glossina pallidipes TaxID=7398 RepID=A0A1A9ZFH4_GLOPL
MSQRLKYTQSIKRLPINLKRQKQREQRKLNNGVGQNRKKNQKKLRKKGKSKNEDFEWQELQALISATESELKTILENEPVLADIPYDISPEELEGEIALAKGSGMTIYIQRDGLSTLTIVLPQKKPTIANLKRAIEIVAKLQLKRELRERHAERLKRRRYNAIIAKTSDDNEENTENLQQQQNQKQQHLDSQTDIASSVSTEESNKTITKAARLTGELVCSAVHNGHQHRPNVSWRFLWRVYALYNLVTNQPINDENAGGRQLLSECGIENAQTLKFCKREKYFGRKRQK